MYKVNSPIHTLLLENFDYKIYECSCGRLSITITCPFCEQCERDKKTFLSKFVESMVLKYKRQEKEKIDAEIKQYQDYTNLIKSYRPKRCACTKIIDPKYTQCWSCRNKNTDTCKCGKQKDKKYSLCWKCNQDYHTNKIPLETHEEWRKKYLGQFQ
jgi:hypothetical protein